MTILSGVVVFALIAGFMLLIGEAKPEDYRVLATLVIVVTITRLMTKREMRNKR